MAPNAALAQADSGKPRILERRGFFEALACGRHAAGEIATLNLGESWDIITDMAIKLVPGGHPHHTIASAANAAREAGITADQSIRITIHRPGMKTLGGPLHPANLIDMAHSPPISPPPPRRRGSRLLLGSCERGEDRRSGDPCFDR